VLADIQAIKEERSRPLFATEDEGTANPGASTEDGAAQGPHGAASGPADGSGQGADGVRAATGEQAGAEAAQPNTSLPSATHDSIGATLAVKAEPVPPDALHPSEAGTTTAVAANTSSVHAPGSASQQEAGQVQQPQEEQQQADGGEHPLAPRSAKKGYRPRTLAEVEAAAEERHAHILEVELSLLDRVQQLLAVSEGLRVRVPSMEPLAVQLHALYWDSQVRCHSYYMSSATSRTHHACLFFELTPGHAQGNIC
jgi:hypothetical protein